MVREGISKELEIVIPSLSQVYGAALLCCEMCSCDREKVYNAFIEGEEINA